MFPHTPPAQTGRTAARPIGVFDSGIGGLSVLRELQARLPQERFVYWADSGHAPYGERGDAFVRERSCTVVDALRADHRVKAVVIACNTATAAAVDALRAAHADLPIVGIEPALKPAAALSQTGHIGVLATRGTLGSARFRALADRVTGSARLHLQACDGLAEAIEHAISDTPGSAERVRQLIHAHLGALGPMGAAEGQIDTLVLGCTHYPLAWGAWLEQAGENARLIDPAEAVARQLKRVLATAGLLNPAAAASASDGIHLVSTGDLAELEAATRRWVRRAPKCAGATR